MRIEGGNNPGNIAHVDDEGKLQTRSVGISEQSSKALIGETYNLNTGELTLTDDSETVLFCFKNTAEDKPMILTRIFVTFLTSTGGSGEVRAAIESDVSGGTIMTQPLVEPKNFNFGSSKTPNAEFRIGGTGITFTGGDRAISFLFTGDNQRHTVAFDSIILPRGASATFTFTPPAGNTSIMLEAGGNVYIDGDF